MAVVRIPCAAIDLTGDATVAGGIFDATRWWRVTHSQHPPRPCAGKTVTRLPAVATALSVYPRDVGHFVPEQYPKVLLLHKHLPPNVPILVADAPAVRRYLQPLIDRGVLPKERILFQPLGIAGTVIVADHWTPFLGRRGIATAASAAHATSTALAASALAARAVFTSPAERPFGTVVHTTPEAGQ